MWTTPLGGQVPCFSTLNTYLTPPPIPSALITARSNPTTGASPSQLPIFAIENVIYAMYYPANPPPSGLSTGAQAGIGAGVGVAGLALIALGIFFLLRRRRAKGPKSDSHNSGSTLQGSGPESRPPGMEQVPTVPYIATQHQGLEHHPYANNNPATPPRGYVPQQNPAVPLGGYLPQEEPEHAPRPAYQSWPPVRDQHWQTAHGVQVSPPTSTASPPPDSRYGDGYSSPGSYTGLRPGHALELHADQQERWELGGRP
jgi:MYXO-CTERM domain-containing protein